MKKNNKLFFCNISLYILIKLTGTFFALYIFDSFSPLVDAKYYLQEGDAFYYLQHGNIYEIYPLRNYIIQNIAKATETAVSGVSIGMACKCIV